MPLVRFSLLFVGLVGAAGLACVSHVSIEGAPCPCPEPAMTCCPTLQQCVSSPEACPRTYPASSLQPCRLDRDCSLGELCESWTVDGAPAGPGQCRRACSDGLSCAPGEVCDPAPHDGRPLADVQVARMCVSEIPEPGCEGQGCHACPEGTPGGSYCKGNTVMGCLFAAHPRCGLTCRQATLSECEPKRCLVQDGVAQCEKENLVGDISPCVEFACDQCVDKEGSFFCDGSSVSACVAMPIAKASCQGGCTCDQVCVREVIQTCTTCSTVDEIPACLP